MEGLHQLEIVILLLGVVLALTTLAQKIVVPYPILLVIGGLVLSLIPGVPTVTLNPDLVFLVFLPPILWAAAYFTSWREFRHNIRPISLLAVGLVVVTTRRGGVRGALCCRGWDGRRRLPLAPSCHLPMRSRPPRSRSGCTSRGGWSRSLKARVWSTMRQRWSLSHGSRGCRRRKLRSGTRTVTCVCGQRRGGDRNRRRASPHAGHCVPLR